MRFARFAFGSIEVDGMTYEHDLIVDGERVRKRRKAPSKPFHPRFGHTPLSVAEDIPWECRRLIIGTGAYGRLPVMDEVAEEAARRDIELVILPTGRAIEELGRDRKGTNAILHVTC